MASATTFSFTFLLTFYLLKPTQLCTVSTFHNSSVTLVGAKGVKTIDGCFEPTETLKKVSYIQIINESVPVLRRDAINSLPNLVDIILENDSITDIEAGSFYNLPQLYLIKIKRNSFRSVREGVFNKLPLKELCLTNNGIESIHPNAFDDMPNLSILFLNENKISYWSSEWFKRSPKLNVLNFEYNLITSIPARALRNIDGVHLAEDVKLNVSTNVQLNNNRIRYIENGAFEGLNSLGWLFLHRNELEEISADSLGSLESVDWVRLEYNHLKCIPEKLVKISPKVVYYISNNPLTEECKNRYISAT